MMKIIMVAVLLLTACGAKAPIAVAPVEVSRPVLQYTAPQKQMLAPIQWDFPRSSTQVVIKNSSVCIDRAKEQGLDRNASYDVSELNPRCAVPAIDAGSNLYIGLSEANYRNLVNNYSILLLREKRWLMLLKNINTALSDSGYADGPRQKVLR